MPRQMVLIDNCVFDRLKERGVDLKAESGTDLDFRISAFGELEIPSVMHDRQDARETGKYVVEQLDNLGQPPVRWFGFAGDDVPGGRGGLGDLAPDGTLSGGGFLSSIEGLDFLADPERHKAIGGMTGTRVRPTGLLANQTDTDYGVWSINFPLVTDNPKDFKRAGKVIPFAEWTEGAFGDFIRQSIAGFDN
ncbi:hypothetical protein EA797_04585 [Stutzerimonas zhaodongensis]|uniref:Uncharacterized protein n=1 Tax=Stutzerimonas zhaodongensis TaxID=1176257 RepID=A0A3M2HW29_9GAMM|nr:hypothetical protein [Stutzerimonas zhaodongensis]MCQ4314495.1 hypothetical protein [Stutzerimonas zhaodongensis]RMH92013.1 hypothetical protein EA797_04585 [Stutzerimonas zhaodongensis]